MVSLAEQRLNGSTPIRIIFVTTMFAHVAMMAALCAVAAAIGDPSLQADIGVTLTNTSAFVGGNASFHCEVIGDQTLGQELKFYKYNTTSAQWAILSSDASVDPVYTGKYSVTEKYRLNVKDVQWSDEASYRCSFDGSNFDGALVVLDPPTTADLYWPGGRTWTEEGKTANLTCEAGSSRPPATITWYRGTTEITAIAKIPSIEVDANGYGRGMSVLELTPTSSEKGIVYTCEVDQPNSPAIVRKQLAVSFSGSTTILASAGVLLVTLALSLF